MSWKVLQLSRGVLTAIVYIMCLDGNCEKPLPFISSFCYSDAMEKKDK